MRLIVGITEETPGWKIVLQQIGVPYQKVDSDNPIQFDAYALLIVMSSVNSQKRENILHYLRAGGSLLIEADSAEGLFGQLKIPIHIQSLQINDCTIFSQLSFSDFDQWIKIDMINWKEKNSIAVLSFGKGFVIILPRGFVSQLLSTDMKQKFFNSAYGERLPSERVAKVSKRSIRYIIQKAFEYLYHCRGLPFVHLWYFPNGQKNVFAFRVDTDFGTQKDVEQLYQLCRENHIEATWFIETRSQAQWIRYFSQMKDQEMGYHCYRHRIFSDYQSNKMDLQRGLGILRKAGIQPKGYVAPYGEWHTTLGRVLQELQFEYSSEFGLAYDDLPFFPFFDNSESKVLQIPIHPISIGNLRRARHTDAQVTAYYKNMINYKLDLAEPIVLYHHPSHRSFDIIQALFREIHKENIPSMRMGDYSDWWKKRMLVIWTPRYDDEKLSFDVQNGDSSLFVRAILPNKKWSIFPFQKSIAINELPLKEQNHVSTNPRMRTKKQDAWRLILYRMENIYGKLRR